MEFMLRLAKCTTVHFKYIIKIEVIIFHSFTKNKETKRMPMQISKKKSKCCCFIVKNLQIKNTCNLVEVHNNFRNPL